MTIAGHEAAFHQNLRKHRQSMTTDALMSYSGDPMFKEIGNLNDDLWQMHLASASLRLPPAAFKTTRLYRAEGTRFGDLWSCDKDEWIRRKAHSRFLDLQGLGCEDSTGALLGNSEEERLQRAVVAMLVHRDDFGHGEVADVFGNADLKAYLQVREATLDSLCPCRIVETQQVLIRWALDRLL